MKKKIIAVAMAATILMGTATPALAVTPLYKPLGITIPKITVKLSDSVQTAIEKAAEKAAQDDVKAIFEK